MGRWGGALYFLGCRIAYKGAIDGAGNIIYQSLFGTVEDIRLWQIELGPEENSFVSGNFAGFSLYISSEG